MTYRSTLVALAIVLIFATGPAQAACSQADLKGLWRFAFDIGYTPTGQTRSHRLSCLLRIKANGEIVPRSCETVNGSGDVGEFNINTNRPLRVNTNVCEVVLGGAAVFSNDFDLRVGNTTHSANGARLTISPSKNMMLGWLSVVSLGPIVAVTAIRRATP